MIEPLNKPNFLLTCTYYPRSIARDYLHPLIWKLCALCTFVLSSSYSLVHFGKFIPSRFRRIITIKVALLPYSPCTLHPMLTTARSSKTIMTRNIESRLFIIFQFSKFMAHSRCSARGQNPGAFFRWLCARLVNQFTKIRDECGTKPPTMITHGALLFSIFACCYKISLIELMSTLFLGKFQTLLEHGCAKRRQYPSCATLPFPN